MRNDRENYLTSIHASMVANALPHIGPITWQKLLKAFGCVEQPEKIFSLAENQLLQVQGVGKIIAQTLLQWEEYFDLKRELDSLRNLDIQFIPKDSPEYPSLLKQIEDAPIGIYKRGQLVFDTRTISIVGSRRATLYGLGTAKKLARELTRYDYCIVSGMARGIDSSAHEGALEAQGKTIAVLGCGVDIIYPPENQKLYNQIIQQGGAIVSEFPLGRRADKQTFPMRNRIISGLSHALIVVETDMHGGSMITANLATDQGRHVLAIPGRIDQPSSRGCHHLIREGATLMTCVEDLIDDVNYMAQLELPLHKNSEQEAINLSSENKGIPVNLNEDEKEVYTIVLEKGPVISQEIAIICNRPIFHIIPTLTMLELKRKVAKRLDGTFEAIT